jgi:hypothetical protein
MKPAPRYSLADDSKFRSGRVQECKGLVILRNRWDAQMAGIDKLVIGSKDDLEANYGAELEGPFGLIWFSRDGRMAVWSYRSKGRAAIAAYNMARKSVYEKPRLEFL